MAMDVKGITWVGNIYEKFENMCLEVEDIMFEDAVKYIESQMQTVGGSVKKLYSDVMQDFLPPSSCDLDEKVAPELPIDQYTDAGFCKKSFQGSEKITARADTKQTNKDITVKSNLDSDENQQNKKMPATKTHNEITLSETVTCRTSQSCELSNENQNHAVMVSKSASAEVTRSASVADCCHEIENVSTEQIPSVLVFVKSAEEKGMNMSSSSSSALFGDPDETWSLDATKVDTVIEQGQNTLQQDDELTVEETCVMVTRDELQIVPKAGGDLKISKKKRRQPFSLSKQSARKQEYEELAIWHGNNEKRKGDCMENLCQTLLEGQKKLLLPDIYEPEWELL